MLNVFRKRQSLVKIVLGFVLFLVCITMVITLIPGMTGDTGDTASNPVVAEVAGDKITSFEVQQSLQQVSQRNRIPSEMMPFYSTQILNEMVLEKASLQEASRLGLKVSESELLEQLRQNPNIFPNGNFIGQQKYEDLVSEQFGTNVAQFEERFRQALLLDKLRQLVGDSATVSPEEIRKAFIDANEKVVLDYAVLTPEDFKKGISPSDSALQDYFKSKKEQFRVPEKRSVKVLKVESRKIQETIKIPEGEAEKYYRDHMYNYRVPERVSVSHILLKADQKDAAKVAEARKKAEDLLKKLKAGADFEALAKQDSDDKASAANGGWLGWVVRKQTVTEFENAAFSLQPGTLSDPVKTVYGIHIIKVMVHEQAHVLSLEKEKPTIQATLLQEKTQRVVDEEAEQADAALKRSPADIETVAQKHYGVVLTLPPFAQDEPVPNVGAPPEFAKEVFGLQKGQAGSSFAVSEGYVIPVLVDVFPPHLAEYAEVKDQVQKAYIQDQAREKAFSKAAELAKILERQEKKDLKKAAQGLSLTVKNSPPVTRNGTIPSLGNVKDLDPKMFQIPAGGIAGPLPLRDGKVVYQVASRDSPKEEDLAKQKDQIQEQLLDEKRRVAFEVFQDSLKNKLTASGRLKIHKDALAQLTGSSGSKP